MPTFRWQIFAAVVGALLVGAASAQPVPQARQTTFAKWETCAHEAGHRFAIGPDSAEVIARGALLECLPLEVQLNEEMQKEHDLTARGRIIDQLKKTLRDRVMLDVLRLRGKPR